MSEKRFEIYVDEKIRFERKNHFGIKNDMVKFKPFFYEEEARMLCDFINRLIDENKQLKSINQDHKDHLADFYADYDRLEKENEQLKADNNRLVNETAKIVAEHQGRVLDLIDEKIDELEKRYKFGQEVYKGCPMHNIRFGINTLKELKKELQE